MYYTSQNKQELEAYNTLVTQSEGYNGTTQQWSDVIAHKNGGLFAIRKHEKYPSEMQEVQDVSGWFEEVNP